MAGSLGPIAAAGYARAASAPSLSDAPASGRAKLVSRSYGIRLGPLGIEYSHKEVEFSPNQSEAPGAPAASGASASSATQQAFDIHIDVAEAMRLIQDEDAAKDGEAERRASGVSIWPRGLAAYAQSALGSQDKSRRGSVLAVV